MEFLAFGSFWFWILILVSTIWIIFSIETDEPHGFIALIIFIASILLLYFFGEKSQIKFIVTSIIANPLKVFLSIFGYFIMGSIWGVVKWFLFTLDKKEKAIEEKNLHRSGPVKPPQVKEFKNLILTWMCYWPFSAIWTIINDPIKRFYKFIYSHIADYLQKISNYVFRQFIAEEEERKKEAELKKQERINPKKGDQDG